jgi:hypothetical protein
LRLVGKQYYAILALLVLGMLSGNCLAQKTVVVVVASNAEIEELSKQQVADYFLGEKTEPSSITTPLDRNNFALKGRFYRQIAGMSLNRLRAFWAKKVFTSRGRPPKILGLNQIGEVHAFDASLITYMYEEELTDAFKVVYTLPEEQPMTETW